MSEILLTVDADVERALAQVETLLALPLESADIRASILHVFEDNPEGASATQVVSVNRARERLEAAGIETQVLERSGKPKNEIKAAATELDADLVTISGRKRTPAGKMIFGSVTQEVLLETDHPVLVCEVSSGSQAE